MEFDELLRSAGCETSPNMRVMATQAAPARTATGLLRMRGVVGSMAECAADLGNTSTLRRGRRIEAQIGRMKSASKRATGLRRLAGTQWAVRKLAKIGPGAKTMWASTVKGTGPTGLRAARAIVVRPASMPSGSCLLLVERMVLSTVPTVQKQQAEQVMAALEVLRGFSADERRDVCEFAARRTQQQVGRWLRVSGPITAAAATMSDAGWRLGAAGGLRRHEPVAGGKRSS